MNAYDQVPYKSHPFRQTHPDRLSVIASLMGVHAPSIASSRVLELGCASGGNLLPMADQLPNATFVGIDLSSRQIEDGQAIARRAGLSNVDLRHADIMDFASTEGTYDYILCHGVYSWIPSEVQSKILEICGKHLSPNGIAYVSYNTYPGWHMRGMIRDIMRYRAKFFDAPSQQLSQARGLLTFLSESVKTENNAYGMLLKNELDSISSADDSYLFHEHLEEFNAPTYFHEFAERAAAAGLQYLGESDFGSMSLENYPDNIKAMLKSVSRDVIETEQYMDFLRNRMFRQTILCRSDLALDRSCKPQYMLKMEIASNARPEGPVDLSTDTRVTFRRGSSVLTTSDPVLKAAILHLRDAWPHSVPFIELAATARSQTGGRMVAVQTDSMSQETLNLAHTLLRCFASGQVDLHMIGPRFTTRVSDYPQASNLARAQAEAGSLVTDRGHGGVSLDDFQRQLLMLLDGKRSLPELLDAMVKKVETGTLLLHSEGQRVSTADAARPVIDRVLKPALESLANLALLVD